MSNLQKKLRYSSADYAMRIEELGPEGDYVETLGQHERHGDWDAGLVQQADFTREQVLAHMSKERITEMQLEKLKKALRYTTNQNLRRKLKDRIETLINLGRAA